MSTFLTIIVFYVDGNETTCEPHDFFKPLLVFLKTVLTPVYSNLLLFQSLGYTAIPKYMLTLIFTERWNSNAIDLNNLMAEKNKTILP